MICFIRKKKLVFESKYFSKLTKKNSSKKKYLIQDEPLGWVFPIVKKETTYLKITKGSDRIKCH